jgi:hypothetical protein
MSEQGPNVKRLIAIEMARIAVPDDGCFGDGLAMMVDSERTAAVAGDARKNVAARLAILKAARDNPHGDDDEAIAADVLKWIDSPESGGGQVP